MFDAQESGLPMVWIITYKNGVGDISKWLQLLKESYIECQTSFSVNEFMTDDVAVEI